MYQELLDKIVPESKRIFRLELTEIYLHGSMAMQCFINFRMKQEL